MPLTYKTIEAESEIQALDIPQYNAQGQYENQALMPSFLYIPNQAEITLADINLPWQSDSTIIVGQYAKAKAQTTPNRIISSAKSWALPA